MSKVLEIISPRICHIGTSSEQKALTTLSKSLQMVTATRKLKNTCSLKEKL